MSKRKKLFSVTKKDFIVQTFRAGGKGGQNQNKRDSGVRIIHPESGARGEGRSERSQHRNRRLALERLAKSKAFQSWVKVKAAQVTSKIAEIDKQVDQQMHPRNLQIEGVGPDGQWQALESET